MADRNVNIWLRLKNAGGVAGGLKALGGGFISMGRTALGAFQSIGSAIFSLKSLIMTGLVYGAFRMLKGVIGELVGAYGQSQVAIQSLNSNLQSQGHFSDYVTQRLQAQAAAIQKVTALSDEQIMQGQAVLASYGANGAMIERITPIVLNFAEATGQDIGSAFELAGKASVGYTATLSRYGIIIDENIPKSQKFEAALAAMAQRGGKAALDYAQTAVGAWKNLGNAWDEVKEKLGKFLVESGALTPMWEGIRSAIQSVDEWLVTNKDTIQAFVDEGIKQLVDWATRAWDTIKGWAADGTIFGWIVTAMAWVNRLWGAFKFLGQGVLVVYNAIKANAQAFASGILWMVEKVLGAWKALTGKGGEALKAIKGWRQFYDKEGGKTAENFDKAWAGMGEALLDIGDAEKNAKGVANRWRDAFVDAQNAVTNAKKRTGDEDKKNWDRQKQILELTKEQKDALTEFANMGKLKQEAVVDLLKRAKGMPGFAYGQLSGEEKEMIGGSGVLKEAYKPAAEQYAKEELKRRGVTNFAGIDLTQLTTPEKIEATAKVEITIQAGEDIAKKAGDAANAAVLDLLLGVQHRVEEQAQQRRDAARGAAVALQMAG